MEFLDWFQAAFSFEYFRYALLKKRKKSTNKLIFHKQFGVAFHRKLHGFVNPQNSEPRREPAVNTKIIYSFIYFSQMSNLQQKPTKIIIALWIFAGVPVYQFAAKVPLLPSRPNALPAAEWSDILSDPLQTLRDPGLPLQNPPRLWLVVLLSFDQLQSAECWCESEARGGTEPIKLVMLPRQNLNQTSCIWCVSAKVFCSDGFIILGVESQQNVWRKDQ